MLTPQEINFLYQLLDQINVRGEESKAQILAIMRKLRLMSQPKGLVSNEEEEVEPVGVET